MGPGIRLRLPRCSLKTDMGRELILGSMWKITCNDLFITYFKLKKLSGEIVPQPTSQKKKNYLNFSSYLIHLLYTDKTYILKGLIKDNTRYIATCKVYGIRDKTVLDEGDSLVKYRIL